MLDVISRSAFDLSAVFEAVVESSVRLCGAERGFIYRFDGDRLRVAVGFNVSQQLREFGSVIRFDPAGKVPLPAQHSNAERSIFQTSSPIRNILTARRE